MKTVQISLNSIDKVKSFVNDITKFDYDFDLVSGRYVIDAKSIMGFKELHSLMHLISLCEILKQKIETSSQAARFSFSIFIQSL